MDEIFYMVCKRKANYPSNTEIIVTFQIKHLIDTTSVAAVISYFAQFAISTDLSVKIKVINNSLPQMVDVQSIIMGVNTLSGNF
jgi:hypothetical protein